MSSARRLDGAHHYLAIGVTGQDPCYQPPRTIRRHDAEYFNVRKQRFYPVSLEIVLESYPRAPDPIE
jgi:hypothetical protein